jgi:hypothetical protein
MVGAFRSPGSRRHVMAAALNPGEARSTLNPLDVSNIPGVEVRRGRHSLMLWPSRLLAPLAVRHCRSSVEGG